MLSGDLINDNEDATSSISLIDSCHLCISQIWPWKRTSWWVLRVFNGLLFGMWAWICLMFGPSVQSKDEPKLTLVTLWFPCLVFKKKIGRNPKEYLKKNVVICGLIPVCNSCIIKHTWSNSRRNSNKIRKTSPQVVEKKNKKAKSQSWAPGFHAYW